MTGDKLLQALVGAASLWSTSAGSVTSSSASGSIPLMTNSFLVSGNETEIPSKIVAPQMFMNEDGVSDSLKHGGIYDQTRGDKLVIEEFPDMVHGLTFGEDMHDHNIARDVERARKSVEIIKYRISDYFINSFAGFIFHSFIVSLIVNSKIQKESL